MGECKACFGKRVYRGPSVSVPVAQTDIRLMVAQAKKNPCVDCGARLPPEAMDFDHIPGRGEKLFAISQVPRSADVSMVRRELAKCELVCACCHRVRTVKRKRAAPPITPLESLKRKVAREPLLADLMAAKRGEQNAGGPYQEPPNRDPGSGRFRRKY
jgi:hypothetical protein